MITNIRQLRARRNVSPPLALEIRFNRGTITSHSHLDDLARCLINAQPTKNHPPRRRVTFTRLLRRNNSLQKRHIQFTAAHCTTRLIRRSVNILHVRCLLPIIRGFSVVQRNTIQPNSQRDHMSLPPYMRTKRDIVRRTRDLAATVATSVNTSEPTATRNPSNVQLTERQTEHNNRILNNNDHLTLISIHILIHDVYEDKASRDVGRSAWVGRPLPPVGNE